MDNNDNVLDDVLDAFTKHNTESDMPGIRLNKAIAEAGICSRRQADTFIESGKVKINGVVVAELGKKVSPGDKLEVNGKKAVVANSFTSAEYENNGPDNAMRQLVYVVLNKPTHVVSTASDPEERETVLDLLPEDLKKNRLYPVGRLDYFSEGLIIITNDGELTQRLTHPKYHLPKTYMVDVREEVTEKKLSAMRDGMTLDEGEKLAPVEARLSETSHSRGAGQSIEMVLHQGINRQIRRMCRDLDLTILRLVRVMQGPIRLGELPVGKTRYLSAEEVKSLKKAVGLI